ncbi:MAG: AmmeMemoRadiSam system radical SAM enzyme [Candidatus Omnitrophica bacterium]|nr:AmmeMemoRadiSam system radical SAM enzyme [Candidatus Omnitrophota bacterium]
MREARFYRKEKDKKVQCNLCAFYCLIPDGKRGVCLVRENRGGVLYTLVYGKLNATHVDPIEKKPLFHFYPGSLSFSISAPGCNFRCSFCQNYAISQEVRDHGEILGKWIPPEDVVSLAKRSGCRSISYTYTEPTMFMEYAYDVAKLANEHGLKNVFVSNGYMTAEALKVIAPYLDAINVDLKAYREETYLKVMGAKLAPVKETIKLLKELGVWTEITTLIIPTINDGINELKEAALFIKSVSEDIPWHLSRFHPDYKLLDLPITPENTLIETREMAKSAGLKYVYIGNVLIAGGEDTLCYNCGRILIERSGFEVVRNSVSDNSCRECGAKIAGRW